MTTGAVLLVIVLYYTQLSVPLCHNGEQGIPAVEVSVARKVGTGLAQPTAVLRLAALIPKHCVELLTSVGSIDVCCESAVCGVPPCRMQASVTSATVLCVTHLQQAASPQQAAGTGAL